jgi:hypothetical protein
MRNERLFAATQWLAVSEEGIEAAVQCAPQRWDRAVDRVEREVGGIAAVQFQPRFGGVLQGPFGKEPNAVDQCVSSHEFTIAMACVAIVMSFSCPASPPRQTSSEAAPRTVERVGFASLEQCLLARLCRA